MTISRNPSWPEPGFYRCRFVKGGPFVPCRIVYEEGAWMVLIAGKPTDPVPQIDPWTVRGMERVYFSPGMTAEEYERQMAALPDGFDPFAPIDWSNIIPKED